VALWREALLAQKVLRGETQGYRHHPQLLRFRAAEDSGRSIADYLLEVQSEAAIRGYRFDGSKVGAGGGRALSSTQGQLDYEWEHLLRKLEARDPAWLERIRAFGPIPHPLFVIRSGPVEDWERV
jgi:hypothetical protein